MAEYKYPILLENKYKQINQALPRINNENFEYATLEAQYLSMTTSIVIIITLMYIYWTSRKYLTFNIKKNSNTYTFSEALEKSEKIGTISLMILFLALLQTLFTVQNFNGTDMERSSIVGVNYLIILGMLLLFYIGPNKHIGHGIIAIILTTVIVYSTSMINVLYHKYYKSEYLLNINILSNIILYVYAGLSIVFIIFAGSRFSGYFYVSVHHILGISEFLLLFLYAIFIACMGQLPRILSDTDLSCTTNTVNMNQ